KASLPPSGIASDSSSLPRSRSVLKMPSAGGQVARQTVAPASASAFAMANPNPASSATPATRARFPCKSIGSIAAKYTVFAQGSKAQVLPWPVDLTDVVRKTRVFVIDDSPLVRQVLGYLIERDHGLEIIGSAADGAAAWERIVELDPDVLTLDADMP